MKFVCLVYFEEKTLDALSGRQVETLWGKWAAYAAELRREGRLLGAHDLGATPAATTIRIRRDRISAADGPFAETDEQLRGLMVIEAVSLEEAVRLVAKLPTVQLGSVEVRPVRGLEVPPSEAATSEAPTSEPATSESPSSAALRRGVRREGRGRAER